MRKMINPVPNLNGNTAESLITPLGEVLTALHGLEKAMRGASACYHGRNFQTLPHGAEAQRAAQAAWHERFEWLSRFEHEIEDMRIAIQQGDR
jgi:hypothetical protein